MSRLSDILRKPAARVVGWCLLGGGLASGTTILVAGKRIGDQLWAWRGYPLDIGPEMLFWGNRGLILAFVLCVAGTEILLARRGRKGSGRANGTPVADGESDQADKDRTGD